MDVVNHRQIDGLVIRRFWDWLMRKPAAAVCQRDNNVAIQQAANVNFCQSCDEIWISLLTNPD